MAKTKNILLPSMCQLGKGKEMKYNAEDYATNNIANYARNTADALKIMPQVNNATGEEQAQQMMNLKVQNQEINTQLDSITTQLAQL